MNIFEKLRLAEHWLSVWTQDTVNIHCVWRLAQHWLSVWTQDTMDTLCVKVGSILAQGWTPVTRVAPSSQGWAKVRSTSKCCLGLASMVTLGQHYMPTLAGCWRQPWFFSKKSQGSQGWPANPGPTWGAKVGQPTLAQHGEPTLSQHWIKGKLGYCLETISCVISMK